MKKCKQCGIEKEDEKFPSSKFVYQSRKTGETKVYPCSSGYCNTCTYQRQKQAQFKFITGLTA